MNRQKREWLERLETLARTVIDEWDKSRRSGSLVALDDAIENLEWEMNH